MEANSDLRRAARLLLLLGRLEFTDAERRQIADEFGSFTSWKHFAGLAMRHGVAPLVWQNIMKLSLTDQIPGPERAMLESLRLKSIARVSWITEAAYGVTSLLEEEGIRVLLLKGLALEHTVYGSAGLRQMSDADLLVAPGDALRARDILIREGFRSMSLKSPLYRHIILDLGNHLPGLHREGLSVDLHFRLFGPDGGMTVEKAIEEAVTITAGEKSFRVLPPMISFLALVRHIRKHELKGEFQLRLWTDIYLLLNRYGESILNEELAAVAEETGMTGEVRTVLTVMEREWGVKIPGTMHARPGPEEDRVIRFSVGLMYPGSLTPISPKEVFSRNLLALDGVKKKAIYVTGDIFPSVGFMKKRYGCRTTMGALMHYPHRLGKLTWLFGLSRVKNRYL